MSDTPVNDAKASHNDIHAFTSEQAVAVGSACCVLRCVCIFVVMLMCAGLSHMDMPAPCLQRGSSV